MSLSANAYSGMTHLQDPSEFADDGYGSLMGSGGAKKKKKPVLVLDADELEQAHQAIAMGGQTIMEAEDEPEAMERIRMPSSLLGLAPMGSHDDEDESDYGLTEEGAASFADQEPEDYSEEGLSEEEEMEDDSSFIESNLEHLLRPASREESDLDDEESIPSIEDQLKRMRALPIQSDEPVGEDESYSFESAPEMEEPVEFELEDNEPFYSDLGEEEPVAFQTEDMEALHSEPEELEPQSLQPEEFEPEAEEHHGGEEQQFVSDEPEPVEDVSSEAGVETDFAAWPAPEPEAEIEPEMVVEPEAAPELDDIWSANEAEPAPEAETESAEDWSEPTVASEPEFSVDQDWSTLEEASVPELAEEPGQDPVSDLPEVEWAPESLEAPLDFTDDAAPFAEPVEVGEAAPAISEDDSMAVSDASLAEDEDRWETPEADWSQPEPEPEPELVDPVELAVPAVDESAAEEEEVDEAPLSFVPEELEEVEEAEVFVSEPEPAPAPEPELPPLPRNALRARVFQMEEERQARPASLLGRIWQRLFGR